MFSLVSAKHLHTPDEQLHHIAGSIGYVAPEVLLNQGHGKPVDIWSAGYVYRLSQLISQLLIATRFISIITYVMLCGYMPFRSENSQELIRETVRAKIEFHDRYWGPVSEEGL